MSAPASMKLDGSVRSAPYPGQPGHPIARFYPPIPDSINIYQQRMQALFESVGWQVQPLRMQAIFEEWNTHGFTAVVNWPELRILGRRHRLSLLKLIYVLCWERWLRWRADRVIFVLHNHYVHDSSSVARRVSEWLVSYFRRHADHVMVHAPRVSGWDSRHHYVPHPLYPASVPSAPDSIPEGLELERCYLVFGIIAPYKGLDTLIDRWPTGSPLLIIGSAHNMAYVKALRDRIDARGLEQEVHCIPGFVEEHEAAYLMTACRAVLLLHESAEMIASGSFFHAISYGATVIVRNRAFYNQLRDSGFTCFHSIATNQELIDAVRDDRLPRIDQRTVVDSAHHAFGDQTIRNAITSWLDASGE